MDVIPGYYALRPENSNKMDFSYETGLRLSMKIISGGNSIDDVKLLEGAFDQASHILILLSIVLTAIAMSLMSGTKIIQTILNSVAILFRQGPAINAENADGKTRAFFLLNSVAFFFINMMYCS